MNKFIRNLISLTLFISGGVPLIAQQTTDSLAKRHAEMMAIMMTQPKHPIKTIGIYVYDGYNSLDAFGPYHVFSELGQVDLFFVAKQKGMIRNQRGLQVQVNKSIDEVSHLDILVIPGGAKETFMQTQDTTVLNWIKKIDQTSTYTTSVCTGAWILGATGLLKDKQVTTNWYRAEEVMKMYGAKFQQQRYVQDGKYWTSAGVTAGMDMALGIVNDLMGEKYTKGAMLDLEYSPKPPYAAGDITNTDDIVVEMMRTMYDMGLQPLLEAEKTKRPPVKKPTLWEVWPALDAYHKVMAATFHPSENGDLKPLMQLADDLAAKASILKKSAIPLEYQKTRMSSTLDLLEKESIALAQMVKKKKSVDQLKKSIAALHDRFHEIVEKCSSQEEKTKAGMKQQLNTKTSATGSPLIEKSKDPVCGMMLPKGHSTTLEYEGHLYGFCTEICKAKFKAEPSKYQTNY